MWLRSEATPKDVPGYVNLIVVMGGPYPNSFCSRAMRHAGVFGKAVGPGLHIKASILSLFQAKLRTSFFAWTHSPSVLSSSPEGVADLVFSSSLLFGALCSEAALSSGNRQI